MMIEDLINVSLKKYIEETLFPEYNKNERGHDIKHIQDVIRRSFKLIDQNKLDVNENIVYVVAAYHDIGHHIDRKKHEIISAEIMSKDENLKKFFSKEELLLIKEAIEDHRASAEHEPRSIYGKIVSSADRNTSVEVTLKRCYSYNKKHSQNLMENEVIEKCRRFLLEKFGEDGYARSKMYFDDKEYEKYLYDITELALNSEKFSMEIKRVNGI